MWKNVRGVTVKDFSSTWRGSARRILMKDQLCLNPGSLNDWAGAARYLCSILLRYVVSFLRPATKVPLRCFKPCASGALAALLWAAALSTTTTDGLIDLDEFVSGCMQLHGPAKSLQLAKMSFENKRLTEHMRNLVSSQGSLLL